MLLIQFWCYWFSSENTAITELFGNGSVLCQNQCCFSSMFGLIWLRTSLCNFNTIVTMFKWNTSCFQHVAHVRQNLYIIYEVLKVLKAPTFHIGIGWLPCGTYLSSLVDNIFRNQFASLHDNISNMQLKSIWVKYQVLYACTTSMFTFRSGGAWEWD